MAARAHVVVLDIGKTNLKAAVVDTEALAEVDRRTRPNAILPGPPYPHVDIEAIWAFVLESLRGLGARHKIEALVATAHGATAALVDGQGELALPILDYEHPGPDELAAEYGALRPGFAESGSPRLPHGLNLGAQLFWQFRAFPDAAARTAAILTYPQYWAFRLCGVASTEATSLGCHTDLWNPRARRFSSLVRSQGWTSRMAPLRGAAEILCPVTPAVAEAAALDPETPVLCGIHDSNASLLPHLRSGLAPFSVVSTGTWVISMAVGGRAIELDPQRDTLINVNAFGDPVPSARFMGGREWETTIQGRASEMTPHEVGYVVERGIRLLPAIEAGSGPFAGRAPAWSVREDTLTDGQRAVAVSFYLALMTATCLSEIGADGPIVLEGPFAANAAYAQMLGAATGRPILLPAGGGTGTSIGAALLMSPDLRSRGTISYVQAGVPESSLKGLSVYAHAWRRMAGDPQTNG